MLSFVWNKIKRRDILHANEVGLCEKTYNWLWWEPFSSEDGGPREDDGGLGLFVIKVVTE